MAIECRHAACQRRPSLETALSIYRKRLPISALRREPIHIPGLARPLDLGAPVVPAPPYQYRVNSLVTSQLDVRFASSLNFPDDFVASLDASMSFYVLDFMATLPEMLAPEYWGDYGVVWGFLFRVGIATKTFSGNLSASIAGVAANTEINAAASSYYAMAIGLGPLAVSKGGPFFGGGAADFNADAVEELGQGLQGLSSYLIQQSAGREPVPVYVVALREEAELSELHAVTACYALNCIYRGDSCETAISRLNSSDKRSQFVNLLELKSIYLRIVNDIGTEAPSAAQRQLAADILNMRGNY